MQPLLFPELPPTQRMYEALVARDESFVGVFVACVRTTGIFCLPTCRARKPKRENVDFVATAADALRDGYRPCKVCKPLEPAGAHPDWVEALLEAVRAHPDRRLTDADLVEREIDPVAARRYFKRAFGVTFQGWQRATRVGAAMGALRGGRSVASTTGEAGFESESGFREAWQRLFGASPGTASTSGGALVADRLTSKLGPLLAAATDDGLALLEFLDRRMLETQVDTLRRRFGAPVVPGRNAYIDRIERELDAYFAGSLRTFEVPLDVRGTPFQESVWRALRDVPYGRTTSYAELAAAIGRPGAARAVGRANGDNRIAIVLPCHRVVGADGQLTGYGGGLWRKRRLLELEQAAGALDSTVQSSET
ncbi:MAG: methylated-DNA--[protein]-cysteine S-methyltransferase [Planctomycetota bacterium]